MNVPTVKFNTKDQPEFFKELHKRVNQHFKDNNISKHANSKMVFKTVFMICLYILPLLYLLLGSVTSYGTMMLMWVLMGLGMSGIGLSVMHDANHGSYSSNQKVNNALGYLLNILGGYHVNWRIQHNVLHHSFTNIHEHDEDIDKGIMRFSPDQDRKPFFRFQVFYAPFLYALLTIYWFVAKDFIHLEKYKHKNLLEGQGLTYGQAFRQIIFVKVLYGVIFLVLPLVLLEFHWSQVLLGFLIMHFISGLILALIFQPAHVIEETSFFQVDDNGSVENNWAIHQMKTTANFANGSTFFSWFIGGLNYQIEHHLFPHICHVHYKDISPIVKATAEEFNVPYYQHPTFLGAVMSHFSLLNDLGTGAYDKKVANASA